MGRKNVKEIDNMTWSEARAAVKRKGHTGSWVSACPLPVLKDLLSGDITEEQARASQSKSDRYTRVSNLLTDLTTEYQYRLNAKLPHWDVTERPCSLDAEKDIEVLRATLWHTARLLVDVRKQDADDQHRHSQYRSETHQRMAELQQDKASLLAALKLVLK